MPEPFKNLLGVPQVKALASSFAWAWPAFPPRRFVSAASRGLDALELKARARHIAAALHDAPLTLHAGRHRVDVQVNGRLVPAGAFARALPRR